jgi:hypothetical protein
MNRPWEEPPVQYGYQPAYPGQPPRGNSSLAIAVIAMCTTLCLFCCCGGVLLVPLSLARVHVPAPARAPQFPALPVPVRARQIPPPPRVSIPKPQLPSSVGKDTAGFNEQQKRLEDMRKRSQERIDQMRKDAEQRRQEMTERHDRMMRDLRQAMPRPTRPGEVLPERP